MKLGIKIENFNMIDKIDSDVVEVGIRTLINIDAISKDKELTAKGELLAEFQTEPLITNSILQAFKRNCVDEIIKILVVT